MAAMMGLPVSAGYLRAITCGAARSEVASPRSARDRIPNG
jgi:hypothetical protein